MEKHRSLKQYRGIDLVLFALMLLVFESIIVIAGTRWFPGQPYSLSLVPAVIAIVLVRWGPWAAIHAVLGGAVLCFQSGATASQYVLYCGGNLFSLLLVPFLSRWRKETGVWKTSMQAIGYGVAVLLLIQSGRGVLSLLLGADFSLALGCFTTESITDLFTLVILWIVRRLDGVLEDQVHYLRRIQAAEEG